MSNKVPFAKALQFMREYENDAKYTHLRLGQAFCNEFLDSGTSDPELYYINNYYAARAKIFAEYVELQA